jgi:hypothetical protein
MKVCSWPEPSDTMHEGAGITLAEVDMQFLPVLREE